MSVTTWQVAFLVTVLVELPIVVATTRQFGVRLRRRVALAFVAQWLTHPVVWVVVLRSPWLSGVGALCCSELWAWLVEAGLYALFLPGLPPLRAAAVSALANGASLGFGVLLAVCDRR